MNTPWKYRLAGCEALLATMHGKERVIAPLLQNALGVRVRVPKNFDTDRFGTFSRDIARAGTQLDAARAKLRAAFEYDPTVRIVLASEGTSGPHPYVPFAALNREILVLLDRESGLELIGHHATPTTRHAHMVVLNIADAMAFAERIGFPLHGLIVSGVVDQEPAPTLFLDKTISDRADLVAAVARAIEQCGAAFVETDLRAHRNPTRMRAIKRATLDLVRSYRSICPSCGRPGFIVTERVPGLPCEWCDRPTQIIRSEVRLCPECGKRAEQLVERATADPGQCEFCNP